MSATLITPTGDRPLAFSLCQRWVMNQTVTPSKWLIIDDGKIPMDTSGLPGYAFYIRREPKLDDPQYTLIRNMQEALPQIAESKVLIIEDDEYYAPKYVEEMCRRLDTHEVVGIGRSKYYHLPSGGYSRYVNMDHASLAQTAFRATFIPEFSALLKGDVWLDIRIWQAVGKRGLVFDDEDDCLYVGMKGMPGRVGIGVGHRQGYNERDSPDRDMLRRWTRDDFHFYQSIIEEAFTTPKRNDLP